MAEFHSYQEEWLAKWQLPSGWREKLEVDGEVRELPGRDDPKRDDAWTCVKRMHARLLQEAQRRASGLRRANMLEHISPQPLRLSQPLQPSHPSQPSQLSQPSLPSQLLQLSQPSQPLQLLQPSQPPRLPQPSQVLQTRQPVQLPQPPQLSQPPRPPRPPQPLQLSQSLQQPLPPSNPSHGFELTLDAVQVSCPNSTMMQARNSGRQALALPRDTLAFFIKCAVRDEHEQRVLPVVCSSQFTFVNQQAMLSETLFLPYAAASILARRSTWSSRLMLNIALCRVDVRERATNEWATGFFQLRHVDRWIVDLHRMFTETDDDPQQRRLQLGYCVISIKAI